MSTPRKWTLDKLVEEASKYGTIITESEIYVTTNAGGRAEAAFCQAVVPMIAGDYIEVFVENDTAIADITVSDLNVIMEALN